MSNFLFNFNGIKFIIYGNEKSVEKIKSLLKKMIPSKSDFELVDFNYHIHYFEDERMWSTLESLRMVQTKFSIKPNIERLKLNDKDFFYSKNQFYVFNEGLDYYIYSKNNKYAIFYVILELIQRTFEKCKYFIYHGTGVGVEEINMSIIGNSGSGKTTLMSKFFQSSLMDKRFLSNDRILLGHDYTSAFPIEIHLNSGIIENDTFLRKRNYADDCYIKPCELLKVYPDLKIINFFRNNIIILPKIDLFNKNELSIYSSNEFAYGKLNECCFTILDRETQRQYWLMHSAFSKSDTENYIKNLNNYLINNFTVLFLSYGCNVSGEEIYEKIRKKI